jgi:hypothetical protein
MFVSLKIGALLNSSKFSLGSSWKMREEATEML